MFNTKIPLYGICIIIALFLNVFIVAKKYNKNFFTKEEIIGAIVFENIGIFIGAKFLFFLENYSMLEKGSNFYTWGLSSYGGVIGAILMLFIFAISFKKSKKELFLAFSYPLPLIYAVAKIGCFFAGCCFGIEYHGIGNIVYNYSVIKGINGLHLFPIQIVETFTFLIIFLIIKKNYSLKKAGLNIALCGFFKFLLEFLRMSHVGKILTHTQIISLLIFILGIIIIIKNYIDKKKKSLL